MRKCERCEKSYKMGGKRNLLRGHYNPTPKKKKKANLQWTNLYKESDKRRSLVCTRCLKTLTKNATTEASSK